MDAGLAKIGRWRHGAVGAVIAANVGLGAVGVLGGGTHPERFDSVQIVIAPAGGEGLRITEVLDQDFGTNKRHGPLITFQNDFGVLTDLRVDSPTAPDDVQVSERVRTTEVRIGDPDVEITGQHRYVLSYTLPEANLSSGYLAVDAISDLQFPTDAFEVVITGFELDEPRCFYGRFSSTDECPIEAEGNLYRSTFDGLDQDLGVTVEGTILGFRDVEQVPPPPLPEYRSGPNRLLGSSLGLLGLATAVPTFLWARRRGRNEVFGGGGAADAAFGKLPPPGAPAAATPATRLITDAQLDELATIEFVPPEGLDPWQGAVLLTERFDASAPVNYLSGLAAREIISITEDGSKAVLARGPNYDSLDAGARAELDRVFAIKHPYRTGKYDSEFASAWTAITKRLKSEIGATGWWKHGTPVRSSFGTIATVLVLAGVLPIVFLGGSFAVAFGIFKSWPVAIGVALVVPLIAAFVAYRTLLPARTAPGSALALRTESFRRFLEASEGQHVEWAWKHGLLREYSAWAVALDAADAWRAALARANVPEPAHAQVNAVIVPRFANSVQSSYTKPSSSGSGGGSGGGFSGGGGGGGSHGSW